jgi:hypothetical protein
VKHRHHLVCIAAGLGLVAWFLLAGSGGATLASVSLALLLCPLVMGVVMWLLVRQPRTSPHDRPIEHRPDASVGQR